MSDKPNFREEVPEIEEFVDWLCDHEDDQERSSLRIQREALYNAYLKGKAAVPEALEPEPVAWIVHADHPWVTMLPPVEGGMPRTPLYKRSTPQDEGK